LRRYLHAFCSQHPVVLPAPAQQTALLCWSCGVATVTMPMVWMPPPPLLAPTLRPRHGSSRMWRANYPHCRKEAILPCCGTAVPLTVAPCCICQSSPSLDQLQTHAPWCSSPPYPTYVEELWTSRAPPPALLSVTPSVVSQVEQQ
jgi:hypothetical protein